LRVFCKPFSIFKITFDFVEYSLNFEEEKT